MGSFGGIAQNVIIKNNLIQNNTATTVGGGIYAGDNVVLLNDVCAENTFKGNEAPVGPNIFLESNVYVPPPCTTN